MYGNPSLNLLLLIGVFCLSALTYGRSISMVGDITIEITDEKIICGKIECPADTDRCVVTKEKDVNNATVLVRSSICYSANSVVLKQMITNEIIDSNATVNVHVEVNRNGITSISNSYNSYTSKDFDEEQFREELKESMTNWQKEFQKEMESLGDEFDDLYI